jgi:hypothetical protein
MNNIQLFPSNSFVESANPFYRTCSNGRRQANRIDRKSPNRTIREFESEWEKQEASHYSSSQMENEAEEEFSNRQTLQDIYRVAKITVSFARQLIPIVAKTAIEKNNQAATGAYIKTILRQGNKRAEQLEAELFGTRTRAIAPEMLKEAALVEVLAAEASHTHSETEAVAFIGTTLPIIVRTMGAQPILLPSIPLLVVETARLITLLYRWGLPGRRFFRLFPSLLRRIIASLQVARQLDFTITPALVRQIWAAQLTRVLRNSEIIVRGILRNALIWQRTVLLPSVLNSI